MNRVPKPCKTTATRITNERALNWLACWIRKRTNKRSTGRFWYNFPFPRMDNASLRTFGKPLAGLWREVTRKKCASAKRNWTRSNKRWKRNCRSSRFAARNSLAKLLVVRIRNARTTFCAKMPPTWPTTPSNGRTTRKKHLLRRKWCRKLPLPKKKMLLLPAETKASKSSKTTLEMPMSRARARASMEIQLLWKVTRKMLWTRMMTTMIP
mmetsp:Transcript_8802/g.21723  ORF Transcript_8802/g.21723 Transcript_8802/m.21723 type:complete len:210 (-) Transcript_8802:197-826(-)